MSTSPHPASHITSATLPTLAATLPAAFQATVTARPDTVALRAAGDLRALTWADYGARVRSIAAGLAGLGVRRGDVVAMMLTNRPEFNLVDIAALHLGAGTFSVYNTSPVGLIKHLFKNAGCGVVVTEQAFVAKVLAAKDTTGIDHVICVDGAPHGTISLDDLAAAGGDLNFEASWRVVHPDDLLSIIYTSGTTGPPKGAEITHRSMMAMERASTQVLPIGPQDRLLSYLPSAHGIDRFLTHYRAVVHGCTLTTLADGKKLMAALLEVRPTLFVGVPRVWEKFQAVLEAGICAESNEALRAAILSAIALGTTKVAAEQALWLDTHAGPDAELLAEYARYDEQVLGPLRAKIGLDQARYCAAGGAPSALGTLEFFAAIGLPICEGWGMTELSGVATLNPPGRPKFGTVGRAVPGVELKLADDGELLARGDTVMRGYRKEPKKTAEAIDTEGWMHTGDVATVDADGYVKIVDRKKELIINAAGKNMSPANIEAAVKSSSPLIGQCIAVGDRRPYNVALLVLDPDGAAAFARANGLADGTPAALAPNPKVQELVAVAIEKANRTLSRVEQIKKFTILPTDWLPDSDELTPTMKLKRTPIQEKYAAEIEQLYAG